MSIITPGPPPTCRCGACGKCKQRVIRAAYYKRHKLEVIRKNVQRKRVYRAKVPKIEDILDSEALKWLESIGAGR